MKTIAKPVGFILFALSLALMYPLPGLMAGECKGLTIERPVNPVGESQIRGTATLCIDKEGVQASLVVENLTPGDAYTIWIVYFDDPDLCKTTPCSPVDLTGDDPVGVVGRFDGWVAESSGQHNISGKVGGMRLSSGADFRLGILSHDAASTDDNRYLARQLLTPQDPLLGSPGMSTLVDGKAYSPVARAVFNIP